jgi:ABC-type polysaccharide/polyol phosphate transport system ATPase subunit
MKGEVVVRASEVSKRYKIYANPWDRAREWVSRSNSRLHEEIWALRNVSFDVTRGQCIGIIGRNGSGKSTLLKLLTGVLQPTSGTTEVKGRVLALLELGAGFNPELTGRQNVIASAELMAFPAGYARSRMSEIEAFAELGEYFDYPVKTYSSGMFVRLAFSTFLHLDPEVFIVDEALSVGDVFFQQKCAEAIRRVLDRGTTMLFVSHDMTAVQNLCDEVILLEKGKIEARSDKPESVIADYYSLGRRSTTQAISKADLGSRAGSAQSPREGSSETIDLVRAIEKDSVLTHNDVYGDEKVRMRGARVVNEQGEATLSARIGSWLTFEIAAEAVDDIDRPTFGVAIYDRLNRDVFCIGPQNLGVTLKPMRRGELAVFALKIRMNVTSGEYSFALAIASIGEATAFHANHVRLGPLVIYWNDGEYPFYGMAGLDTRYIQDRRLLPSSTEAPSTTAA